MKKLLFMGCLTGIALFSTQNLQAQKDGEYHLDQNYSINRTGTLHLRSEDADVRITGSNRSDVHLKVDRLKATKGFSSGSNDFKMEVENRNGDLYITEKERSVMLQVGYSRTDYRIDIELPEAASLRIIGEDDDYVVRNVNGKISMETEDGDIELIDCNGNDFEFRLEDGDLKIDGGKGSFFADTEDGDIDIRNGAFEKMEIDVEDGTLLIETSLSENGSYEIQADDARIEFVVSNGGGEFNVVKDDGSVRATSDFDVLRETDHRSQLKLAGGNAKVDIRTNDGRVRLSRK